MPSAFSHQDVSGPVLVGEPINANQVNARFKIMQAESAIHSGEYNTALDNLSQVSTAPGTYARKLAIQAAQGLQDWGRVVEIIGVPVNAEESVYLVTALIHQNRLDDAIAVVSNDINIDHATRNDLQDQIAAKRFLGGK